MTSTEQDRSFSQALRFGARSLAFVATLAVFQGALLWILAQLRLPEREAGLLQRLSNLPMASLAPSGNSGLRFEELSRMGEVDLLFAGSSHAYRSFNPAYFEARGISTFNLGTTAQSPINSLYLLPRALERLKPKVVVYVLFWGVMSGDGVESFLDLVKNSDDDESLFHAALAIRDPRVFNALFMRLARGRAAEPPSWAPGPLERYVGAGYVENAQLNDGRPYSLATNIRIKPKQREALVGVVGVAQRMGARVLLVAAPVPRSTLAGIHNYDDYRGQLEALAASCGVKFVDFNERLQLEDTLDFMDFQHLNKSGVAQFTPALYDLLVEEGYFSRTSSSALGPGK